MKKENTPWDKINWTLQKKFSLLTKVTKLWIGQQGRCDTNFTNCGKIFKDHAGLLRTTKILCISQHFVTLLSTYVSDSN